MMLDGEESPTGAATTDRQGLGPPGPSPSTLIAMLTEREREVLGMIGLGMPMVDIAKRLNRTVKTVEWYRASLGKKLRAQNRVQLARIAIASGLTSHPTGSAPGSNADQRLRAIEQALAAVDAYAWHWDDTQRKLDVSESLLTIAGYTRAEFPDIRFAFPRLSDPETLEDLVIGFYKAIASGGESIDLPAQLVHRDGSRLRVRAVGRIDRDRRGVPLRWRGITRVEHRFPPDAQPRRPLESVGAFEWDARDDHYQACPDTHRLLRRSPGSVGTRLSDWAQMIDPQHRDAFMEQIQATSGTRRNGCTPRVCGDGVTRLFEDNMVFLRDAAGRTMRVVGTTTLLSP